MDMMLCLNFMLLPFQVLSLSLAAMRPLPSERDFTYPKQSLGDCYVDEANTVPGYCTHIQDCPIAWNDIHYDEGAPKTCYFIEMDQYVCCDVTTQPDPNDSPMDTGQTWRSDVAFIFGGLPTEHREFPGMAALGWQSNFGQGIYYGCGGVLIAPKFVLTAAHCTDLGGALPVTVRLGGDNLTQTEHTEDYGIERIITHADYNATSNANDIALLELQQEIFSVQPICIWTQTALAFDKQLIALGYGQTQFAGMSSQQLLKVWLDVVDDADCQPYYPLDILPQGLQPSHLCAGDTESTMDTCQGDSGGPLLMYYGSDLYVVGITSLGPGCGSGPPSIYTRVSYYADWIKQIVGPNYN